MNTQITNAENYRLPVVLFRHQPERAAQQAEPIPSTKGMDSPEWPLIRRLLIGDEEAFAELVSTHHQTLLRLAKLYVSSASVAEEVVQETWLAVLRGLHRFEGRSSLKTWLFRILTNRAKSRGVREARIVPFSSLEQDNSESTNRPLNHGMMNWSSNYRTPTPNWSDETPEKITVDQEIRLKIEHQVERLPEKQRLVVKMRDLEGYDSQEVCDLLEISETYQRVLLHRGRVRVREHLENYLNQ